MIVNEQALFFKKKKRDSGLFAAPPLWWDYSIN
jgi:hypothetical protein